MSTMLLGAGVAVDGAGGIPGLPAADQYIQFTTAFAREPGGVKALATSADLTPPSGTLYKISGADFAGGRHSVYEQVVTTIDGSAVLWAVLHAGTMTYVQLQYIQGAFSNGSFAALVNLSAGTYTTHSNASPLANLSVQVVDLGGGFWRVAIKMDVHARSDNYALINLSDADPPSSGYVGGGGDQSAAYTSVATTDSAYVVIS